MESLKLLIQATKEELQYIDSEILSFLEKEQLSEIKRFHFALHEVIINAIQAREKVESQKEIEIIVSISDTHIKGSVKDYFGGMNQQELKKKTTTFSDCGRGFLIIEHLVDEFKYEMLEDGGFIVTIQTKQKET